jgi:hypothetical protein
MYVNKAAGIVRMMPAVTMSLRRLISASGFSNVSAHVSLQKYHFVPWMVRVMVAVLSSTNIPQIGSLATMNQRPIEFGEGIFRLKQGVHKETHCISSEMKGWLT